ncbi:PD-(D/E)XK nuclease superfamily [Bordetella phage PY223]
MLPAYFDCARRAAAKQFRNEIEAAGFKLRETFPSVGATFGTSAHAAGEYLLRHKAQHYSDASESQALEVAVLNFAEETAEGVEWDDTTPNMNTATFQLRRVVAAIAAFSQRVMPKAVELELRADAGDGFELTGHVDLLTVDAVVRDLKTGALHRPYQSQLGAYSLLARSSGEQVKAAAIDWIARTPKTKPQPPVQTESYPLDACEQAAFATVSRIKQDVIKFRSTGDPWAFPANPMTMMCSARFCSAHGTPFCNMHLKESK